MYQEEDLAAAQRIEVMRRQAATSPSRAGDVRWAGRPPLPTATHNFGGAYSGAGSSRTVTYPGSGGTGVAMNADTIERRTPPSPRVTPPSSRSSAPTEGYFALLQQQATALPFAPAMLSQSAPAMDGVPAPPEVVAATTSTAASSSRRSDGSSRAKRGVPHVYHDHSQDPPAEADDAATLAVRKKQGGVTTPFPEKLYEMLESREVDPAVVAWSSHGRSFHVKQPKRFTKEIMPKYFRQTKLTSFQRQLNLYGFRRLTRGPDSGAYYHEKFLRGRPALCYQMRRQKVKGTGHKQPADANTEPNFYAMPPLTPPSTIPYGSSYTVGITSFDLGQPTPAAPIASSPRPLDAPAVPSYSPGAVVSTSPSLHGAAHLLQHFAVSGAGSRLPAMPLLGPAATTVADPATLLPLRRPTSSGGEGTSASGVVTCVPPTS